MGTARPNSDIDLVIPHGGIGALESSAQAEIRIDPFDSVDWRQKAAEYYAHHFTCTKCIAAGRMSDRGMRCREGKLLWDTYQSSSASSLNDLPATTLEATE